MAAPITAALLPREDFTICRDSIAGSSASAETMSFAIEISSGMPSITPPPRMTRQGLNMLTMFMIPVARYRPVSCTKTRASRSPLR